MERYKYSKHTTEMQETRWATAEEITHAGRTVDLDAETCPVGGLPLISDGHTATVDHQDTHTLIFGATGSKKTRLFCMPMLNIFAKAGESFVATDPKGELYARTSGLVKAMGYNTVVLNFRDIGKGDAWNPLKLPYELYHSGQKELAISMLNDFVHTISEPARQTSKDIFWPEMASALILANLLVLAEAGKPEEMNVTSLSVLCNTNAISPLRQLAAMMDPGEIAALNYNGVFTAAPAKETMGSINATVYSMMRIFNTQKNLCRMLSQNTVDLRNLGREKTAVYIIVPDEKTTYHFLVTTFIKQAYEILISEAQKEPRNELPVRVNFVLDEFCNIPTVPDMPTMISAGRSRKIRYFLVVQSLHQLISKYGEDANTIKGNCDNWVFLTSKELELLREISELCGTVYGPNGQRQRQLISVSELQRLDKEKGEALIMHARQYPIISCLADIDQYTSFLGYDPIPLDDLSGEDVSLFSLEDLLEDINFNRRPCPFERPKNLEDEAIKEQVNNTKWRHKIAGRTNVWAFGGNRVQMIEYIGDQVLDRHRGHYRVHDGMIDVTWLSTRRDTTLHVLRKENVIRLFSDPQHYDELTQLWEFEE